MAGNIFHWAVIQALYIPLRHVLISCPFLVKKTQAGWPISRAQPIVLFGLSGSVNSSAERAAEPESGTLLVVQTMAAECEMVPSALSPMLLGGRDEGLRQLIGCL
eukprot:2959881-Ditylum_brightwellii.AAC.1